MRTRAWADRWRHSRYGMFADAYLRLGQATFHLTHRPTEGWRYTIDVGSFRLRAYL